MAKRVEPRDEAAELEEVQRRIRQRMIRFDLRLLGVSTAQTFYFVV
jgi:hypothetical protein